MRFFLDTEWADTLGSELVSIALVAENGIDYLYAEREILPARPTEFVRSVVYPLLDRDKSALTDQAMTLHVRGGSTPISRTVVKELQPSDPAWPPFAA
ncbi:hypothetical protein VDP41_20920, partial [Xanthomonas campestris pv. campestris]|nr:hypothetical protein [Xanthomonas campestris pv. campestris]